MKQKVIERIRFDAAPELAVKIASPDAETVALELDAPESSEADEDDDEVEVCEVHEVRLTSGQLRWVRAMVARAIEAAAQSYATSSKASKVAERRAELEWLNRFRDTLYGIDTTGEDPDTTDDIFDDLMELDIRLAETRRRLEMLADERKVLASYLWSGKEVAI